MKRRRGKKRAKELQYKKSSGEKVKVCISAVLVENTEARKETTPTFILYHQQYHNNGTNLRRQLLKTFLTPQQRLERKKPKKKTDGEPDCLKFAEKARSQILFHIYRWCRCTEEAQEERHSHQKVLYIQFHFIKKKEEKTPETKQADVK